MSDDKEKYILYNLTDSEFIDYKIKDNDLIFRIAINCALGNLPGFDFDSDDYYIYDIVCHNYKIIDSNFFEEMDLISDEIIGFYYVDGVFKLILLTIEFKYLFFTFDCESISWNPIILCTPDELDYIEETECYKIK